MDAEQIDMILKRVERRRSANPAALWREMTSAIQQSQADSQREAAAMNQALEAQRNQNRELRERLQDKANALRDQCREKKELDDERKRLFDEAQRHGGELRRATATIARLEAENREHACRVESLGQDNWALRRELAHREAECSRLLRELSALAQDRDANVASSKGD
ncbi:hypothetical protein BKA81DRAFT_410985 [Phyllosticta paracitricarpa]